MKIQRFVLCAAFGLAAFGAGVGLIELGNYARAAFVSPKSNKEIRNAPQTPALPTIVPDDAQLKMPTVVVPEPAIDPAEDSKHEWTGAGDYYFSGKTPKGFADFDSLSISTHVWDEKNERLVAIKPTGEIYTLRGEKSEQYKFSAINITGRRVSIVSRSLRGVSFQLDGKFVDEKVDYDADGDAEDTVTVLKGRLTKWKGGKKIAEAKVKFELGGC